MQVAPSSSPVPPLVGGIGVPTSSAASPSAHTPHEPTGGSPGITGDPMGSLRRLGSVPSHLPAGSLGGRGGAGAGSARADAIADAFFKFIDQSDIDANEKTRLQNVMGALQDSFQDIAHLDQSESQLLQPAISGLIESMFNVYTKTISATADNTLTKPVAAREKEYQDMIDLAGSKPWLQAYLGKINSSPALFPKKLGEFVTGILRESKGAVAPSELETIIKFFTYIARNQSAEMTTYLNTHTSPVNTMLQRLVADQRIAAWLAEPAARSGGGTGAPTLSSGTPSTPTGPRALADDVGVGLGLPRTSGDSPSSLSGSPTPRPVTPVGIGLPNS